MVQSGSKEEELCRAARAGNTVTNTCFAKVVGKCRLAPAAAPTIVACTIAAHRFPDHRPASRGPGRENIRNRSHRGHRLLQGREVLVVQRRGLHGLPRDLLRVVHHMQ